MFLSVETYGRDPWDVGYMFRYIWNLMCISGWKVFDTFVSFADVLIYTVIAGLFILLISALLGGD